MNSFYLTLPSNVINEFFSQNKIGDFKTKLPQILNLRGNWSCAVVQISYTKSWFNISNYSKILFFDKSGYVFVQRKRRTISSLWESQLEKIKNYLDDPNVSETNKEKVKQDLARLNATMHPTAQFSIINNIISSIDHNQTVDLVKNTFKTTQDNIQEIEKTAKHVKETASETKKHYEATVTAAKSALLLANKAEEFAKNAEESELSAAISAETASKRAIEAGKLIETSKTPMETEDTPKFKLSAGLFDDTLLWVKQINNSLKNYADGFNAEVTPPELKYNQFTHRVTIVPGHHNGQLIYPSFSEEVETLLGLRDYDNKNLRDHTLAGAELPEKFKAYRSVDLHAGYHTLYLYSNIVQHSFVGNTRAQILREIEVPRNIKFGEQIVITYDKPHYIPLLLNQFEVIHINIKNEMNETVPFEFGRLIVKLHFLKND
jgi:HAMP domain-containing protein